MKGGVRLIRTRLRKDSEPDLFAAANAIVSARSSKLTHDEMLEGLKELFEAQGFLSGLVIDEADALPSSSA